MTEYIHLEEAILGGYIAKSEARLIERVRIDVRHTESVAVDGDPSGRRVLVLDVGPRAELHRMEIGPQFFFGYVFVFD